MIATLYGCRIFVGRKYTLDGYKNVLCHGSDIGGYIFEDVLIDEYINSSKQKTINIYGPVKKGRGGKIQRWNRS